MEEKRLYKVLAKELRSPYQPCLKGRYSINEPTAH